MPIIENIMKEFDEKFKATGASIVGFKRHEYPNLREHQYDEVKSFIKESLSSLIQEQIKLVEELKIEVTEEIREEVGKQLWGVYDLHEMSNENAERLCRLIGDRIIYKNNDVIAKVLSILTSQKELIQK